MKAEGILRGVRMAALVPQWSWHAEAKPQRLSKFIVGHQCKQANRNRHISKRMQKNIES